jgi:two-component system, NtrC family, response regulator AlgB
MASILIVDDEPHIRTHLARHVRSLGHEVTEAADAAAALAALAAAPVDIVLSDIRMAGMDGLALLREVKRRGPETIVLLMTAYATVPQAVEAMRAGAYDYLVKPFGLEEVDLRLSRVLEMQTLRRDQRRLRAALDEPMFLDSASPPMQRALATAERAAGSDVTVLLTGESGTGKTVLGRQIHGWSPRHRGPFVTISCTTLAEHLLESELFGHVRGAFTGALKDKAGRVEAAAGGTLFLDEVGELPPDLQAKLLRFLEDHRFERVGGTTTLAVDARIVAATNRDLEAEVAAGHFRADLYFRLNVVGIRLPALRERPEDVPTLIDHVLAGMAARHNRPAIHLAPAARTLLQAYPWPGNVRELVNALERATVLSAGDEIDVEDLPDRLVAPAPLEEAGDSPASLDELERQHIMRTLAESATLEEAAARLGINVTTLWRKRRRYGIE